MTEIYQGIDFVFTCLGSLFALVFSSWALSIIVLIGLLSLVIRLIISARQKDQSTNRKGISFYMNETNAMTDLLAAATSLFSWVMTQLASVITTITGSPILLLGFLMALVGFVIGITRRLMNLS